MLSIRKSLVATRISCSLATDTTELYAYIRSIWDNKYGQFRKYKCSGIRSTNKMNTLRPNPGSEHFKCLFMFCGKRTGVLCAQQMWTNVYTWTQNSNTKIQLDVSVNKYLDRFLRDWWSPLSFSESSSELLL